MWTWSIKFKQTLSIFYYAFCQTEKNVYQINIHYMYFLEQMRWYTFGLKSKMCHIKTMQIKNQEKPCKSHFLLKNQTILVENYEKNDQNKFSNL